MTLLRFSKMILLGGLSLSLLGLSACQKQSTEPDPFADDGQAVLPPSATPPLETESQAPKLSNDYSALIVLPPGQVYENRVTDLDQTSHAAAIQDLLQQRLIPVYENKTFRPFAAVTRGEAVLWFLHTLIGSNNPSSGSMNLTSSSTKSSSMSSNEESSTTVSSGKFDYFSPVSLAIGASGLFDGYSELIAQPNTPLSREELATLAWIFTETAQNRQLAKKSKTAGSQQAWVVQRLDMLDITDAETLNPKYAYGFNSFLTVAPNLMNQTFFQDVQDEEKPLEPQRPVTRGELAEVLSQLKGKLNKQVLSQLLINQSTGTPASDLAPVKPGSLTPQPLQPEKF